MEKDDCSRCGKPLDTIEIGVTLEGTMQEGICRNCMDHIRFQKGGMLIQYLDTFPVPVLVVDHNGTVQTSNMVAVKMLGKERGELDGLTAGEVFECANARQPEKCGHTVHCSGCAIRMAIDRTWETGQSLEKVPATLQPCEGGTAPKIEMLISTQKAGGAVLLRVDRMGGGKG